MQVLSIYYRSADCDVAGAALVQCTDIIVESAIDPITLARKLYSKQVISETIYKRVRDTAKQYYVTFI